MEQSTLSMHFIGGSFALSAAALWAGAAILWKKLGSEVNAFGMNLGKGLVSLACLGIMFAFLGLPSMPAKAWLLLGLSGIIGITIGDTAYFAALIKLGPRRILVLTTLTPLLSSVMAMILLGERPNLQWAAGTVLTLGGITWVLYERLPKEITTGSWREGIWLGVLAAMCEAIGNILTKLGLEGTATSGWRDGTFIRILFATLALGLYGLATGKLKSWMGPFRKPKLIGVLIIASIVGTFLGILFATASFWYTHVTLASILKSTSPIFIIPLAFIFLKEKITWRAVLGSGMAVAGVILLMTAFGA